MVSSIGRWSAGRSTIRLDRILRDRELPSPVIDTAEPAEGGAASHGVAAVDRALAILAAIEAEPAALPLAQLSRATGLYKSTILRLLGSLEGGGYVVRLRDGRYTLGPMAFRLGSAYQRVNPFHAHVVPVLKDLVEAGQESPSFHVRQDAETRLCMFRLNSHHATLDSVCAGQILPLRRGAAGRTLLAFDGEPGEDFEAIRGAGYTLSRGERDPHCAGLACPVWGPGDRLGGALSLSGPRERFTDEAVAAMLPVLLRSAAAISQALGGRPPAIR
jgi:DNA-binding IclR family transcriptional regulator